MPIFADDRYSRIRVGANILRDGKFYRWCEFYRCGKVTRVVGYLSVVSTINGRKHDITGYTDLLKVMQHIVNKDKLNPSVALEYGIEFVELAEQAVSYLTKSGSDAPRMMVFDPYKNKLIKGVDLLTILNKINGDLQND